MTSTLLDGKREIESLAPEAPCRSIITAHTGHDAAPTQHTGHHAMLLDPAADTACVGIDMRGEIKLVGLDVGTGEVVECK